MSECSFWITGCTEAVVSRNISEEVVLFQQADSGKWWVDLPRVWYYYAAQRHSVLSSHLNTSLCLSVFSSFSPLLSLPLLSPPNIPCSFVPLVTHSAVCSLFLPVFGLFIGLTRTDIYILDTCFLLCTFVQMNVINLKRGQSPYVQHTYCARKAEDGKAGAHC